MTPELERLAREAGMTTLTGWRDDDSTDEYWEAWPEQLARFAMLVEQRAKADERDRLATLCAKLNGLYTGEYMAEAIRSSEGVSP